MRAASYYYWQMRMITDDLREEMYIGKKKRKYEIYVYSIYVYMYNICTYMYSYSNSDPTQTTVTLKLLKLNPYVCHISRVIYRWLAYGYVCITGIPHFCAVPFFYW